MKILMAMDMPSFVYNGKLLSDGKTGGGLATVAYNLSLKLAEKGHQVEIICPSEKKCDIKQNNLVLRFRPDLKINFKNNIKAFGTVKSPRCYENMYRYFYKFFTHSTYDIFHAHTPHLSVGSSIAASEMGIPTILTVHNYWPVCYMNELLLNGEICCTDCDTIRFFKCVLSYELSHKFLSPIHMLMKSASMKYRQKSLRHVTYMITVSQYVKNILMSYKKVSEDKLIYIPNMYSTNDDIPKNGNDLLADRFIWAGRVITSKGLIHLLNAFKLILTDFPEVELYIVGDGPERKNLELFAKRNKIIDNITFTGWIPHDEVVRLMRDSLALVSSSIWPETLNMTNIEAMGNGIPVISTNCGAPAEYIKHGINGLLFEAGNYKELAKYMKFFLRNKKEATEMGLKGYHMVKEKYNPELVVQKHLNLYNKAILDF